MIVIEIHNHREVARRESLLARALHRLAPRFIHRQVEQRVAEEIETQLAERGIEVRIRIRWDELYREVESGEGGLEDESRPGPRNRTG